MNFHCVPLYTEILHNLPIYIIFTQQQIKITVYLFTNPQKKDKKEIKYL